MKRKNKPGKPERGSCIDRAVRSVHFIQTHRYWTVQDLADELCLDVRNARRYVEVLSCHLPIMEVRPARYGQGGFGMKPALYGLKK